MADEIVIPLRLWNHRVNNNNASFDNLTATTNGHMVAGFRFKNAEAAEVNWCLAYPIPSDINGTPAATIEVCWVTADAGTTDNCKWFVNVFDVAYNTTSTDPAAFDDALTVLDASNGQYKENKCEVTLSATAVTSGLMLRGTIKRDATDVQDVLGADVILTGAFLVANKA